MAQLVVRNLENEVREGLRQRALRHGHSMEEEIRAILRDAVKEEGRHPSAGLGGETHELHAGTALYVGAGTSWSVDGADELSVLSVLIHGPAPGVAIAPEASA